MLELKSKTGLVKGSEEAIYNYLSDFTNFAHLLPTDKLQHIEVTGDTLQFEISGMGKAGLRMAEKQPYRLLVIDAIEGSPAKFTFRVNITGKQHHESEVSLSLEAYLNMFVEMMAKAPLQQLIDMIIDKLILKEFS